jgi:hypothetical protein
MPAGLMQQVGETGWHLSHGERSRIFLARALLQNARLTTNPTSLASPVLFPDPGLGFSATVGDTQIVITNLVSGGAVLFRGRYANRLP